MGHAIFIWSLAFSFDFVALTYLEGHHFRVISSCIVKDYTMVPHDKLPIILKLDSISGTLIQGDLDLIWKRDFLIDCNANIDKLSWKYLAVG